MKDKLNEGSALLGKFLPFFLPLEADDISDLVDDGNIVYEGRREKFFLNEKKAETLPNV